MSALPKPQLSVDQLRKFAAGDEPAAAHIMQLMQGLVEANEETRAWISDALTTVETIPSEVLAALAEYCRCEQAFVAGWACKLLGRAGKAAKQYQTAIVHVLDNHPEVTTRQQAAQALGHIGDLSSASLASLKNAAASSDPRLQRLAQQALGATSL